jgi:hypothetical protein
MLNDIHVCKELKQNQKIFRYVNIKQFMSMVENQKTNFTHVIDWEDTWEVPLKRIPVDSEMGESDEVFENYKYVFGQCWSKNGNSDAMWRIYSPNKEGILIQSTVKKLLDSINLDYGLVASVIYYDDLYESICELSEKAYDADLAGALLKRKAFRHEEEIRILSMFPYNNEQDKYIEVNLEPNRLIEGIILDPRCDNWYLDIMVKYCKRAGLEVCPYKSDLYEDNIYEKNKFKIIMRQVPDEEPYF